MFYFKNWLHLGIKYIKDIYDFTNKKLHAFEKLKELYNIPNQDFLKYLSLVQSIPNHWKSQLKHENGQVPLKSTILNNILNAKETNKFVYNLLLQQCTVERAKSEQKWNNIFPLEEFNWKNNLYNTFIINK